MSRRTQAERLAAAGLLLQALAKASPPPVGQADQQRAAAAEATTGIGRLSSALGKKLFQIDAEHDRLCLLVAAVSRCRWCVHLRRTPDQAAFARLSIGDVVCQRCTATVRKPPVGDDARCDLCQADGIVTFWPLFVQVANVVIGGDICQACVDALGVKS